MTTVLINDKRAGSKKKTKKKTSKKAAKKQTAKPAAKKKTKKKTTKKKTASKTPKKTPTSGGVAKTPVESPKPAETKTPATPANTGGKKMTQLEAAFKVLQENDSEMNCKAMVEAMKEKGYWKPAKGGLTPQNTLNAGIGTEIRKKGENARFKKITPGKYVVNPDYKS